MNVVGFLWAVLAAVAYGGKTAPAVNPLEEAVIWCAESAADGLAWLLGKG